MDISIANISLPSDKVKVSQITPLISESVLSSSVSKMYAPKQDIFYEGDTKRSVYQIEAGAVCLYKTLANGRRQIFDFAFPGDVIGLGASDVYSCSAQAVGQATLKLVPLPKLYQLAAHDPNFALGLYRAVSFELEATRDLLLTMGQQNSLERVAIFLLSLSHRNMRSGKNPRLLTIPMTRSDIADLLGMTIETVSRSLTKLRQQRAIEIIRGSIIQIIDLESLKALAGQVSYH
jgi:CRP/FNR family transcriptional regulator, anaerobic regulatory protein